MGVLKVSGYGDDDLTLDAVEGWRVMEILREHGLPIEGLCGGAACCGTCHVKVSPEWAARLHPMNDDEIDQLDSVPTAGPTSRLSCQIIYDESLDGLALELVPELPLTDGAGI